MKTPNPLLLFDSRGRTFACDLLWISEVLRHPQIRPVDGAPSLVRGLIHLRGQIVTALDLESRLGLVSQEPAPCQRCLVFKTTTELLAQASPPTDAELAGTDRIGLLIDRTGDIIPAGTELLPAPPESLSGIDPDCIAGVIPGKNHLISVLQIGPLLTPHHTL